MLSAITSGCDGGRERIAERDWSAQSTATSRPLPRQPFVDNPIAAFNGASTVDDDRRRHGVELRVQFGDLRPVGDDQRRRCVFERGDRRVDVLDFREPLAHVVGGDRVVSDDRGIALLEPFDHGNRPRVPDVIGPRLERESEHRNAFVGDVDVAVEQREQPRRLAVVDLSSRIQHQGFVPLLAGGSSDRSGVFRETAAAPAQTAAEEPRADPVIEPDGVGDLVGVDAVLLADISDIVNEADLGRKEAVVGVLDHLCLLDAGVDDWRAGLLNQGVEDIVEHLAGGLAIGSENDLVGIEKVVDGGSFAEELGVHRHMKVFAERLPRGGFEDRGQRLSRRRRDDRALGSDDVVTVFRLQGFAERFGGRLDDRGVDAAVLACGGRQREEREFGIEDGVVLGGRGEPVAAVGRQQVVESRFVDRRLTGVDRLNDLRVDVDVDDLVIQIGETGCDGGSDVAAPDNTDSHCLSTVCRCYSTFGLNTFEK